MTRLQKLVITWRYWDVQTEAALGTPNWAEYHDQFLAAERALRDAADRLASEEVKT